MKLASAPIAETNSPDQVELSLDPLQTVIADISQGKPVLLVDDRQRENEADLVVAAELATSAHIQFMLNHCKGLICLSLVAERLAMLELPPQVSENTAPLGTNFTVSIDYRELGEAGITAAGRARTIREAVRTESTATDFVSPGYVFPLGAVRGGVLKRRGQTEGSVDLAQLAGLTPAGVICEVMGADGTMLRGERLLEFQKRFDLRMTSVEEIVRHRLLNEVSLRRVAEGMLADLRHSRLFHSIDFPGIKTGSVESAVRVLVYVDDVDGLEHLVLVKGEPKNGCFVRVHSECLTGDVFGSLRCDCGQQLRTALAAIEERGEGVLIYLNQEGRGIGLGNKLRAYELQDQGLDTVEANIKLGFAPDLRDYRAAAQILIDLGLEEVRLMTNNPAKVEALPRFGVSVVERIPLGATVDPHNVDYLRTKRERMGHLFPQGEL